MADEKKVYTNEKFFINKNKYFVAGGNKPVATGDFTLQEPMFAGEYTISMWKTSTGGYSAKISPKWKRPEGDTKGSEPTKQSYDTTKPEEDKDLPF